MRLLTVLLVAVFFVAGSTASARSTRYNFTSHAKRVRVPPTPVITSGPASSTVDTTAAFSFTDSDSNASFTCSLDSATYAACTSPKTYSALATGSHSFAVKAFNVAGTSAAATWSWTVTVVPPPPPPPPPSTSPVPNGPAGTWALAFQDEFDGTALDLAKWSNCWFPPTCYSMNNVLTSPANVAVTGGNLVLTLASSTSGALVSTNPSGGATTGFQFTTGVVEARVWFPGDGTHCFNWPTWWTNGQSWPTNGEHDIAEVLGGSMTVNYHSGSGSHNQGAVPGYWCGGFHTYTLNRKVASADVYYDGTLVKSYPTDDANAPHYLILNAGSSSSYPAYGTASQVQVDYVRAWRAG